MQFLEKRDNFLTGGGGGHGNKETEKNKNLMEVVVIELSGA